MSGWAFWVFRAFVVSGHHLESCVFLDYMYVVVVVVVAVVVVGQAGGAACIWHK